VIAALVLAGGGSTRLGRPKQVEPWGETTLLGHVVAEVEKGPFDLRVVVVGSASEQVLETVDLSQWMVVENPEWEEGIASSLRVGLDAIHRLSRAETVAIFLGDEPTVDQAVISALIAARTRSKRQVVIPKFRYEWGHPVLVDRPLWPRLMSLEGDYGSKALFQAHPQWVEEVWFEARMPRDVDTDEDIHDLRPRQ
jgi:molybdenum cofactor cytidylyltransferase